MRALIVNPSPVRGGAEQMLETFVRRLDPARIALEIVCLAPGPFPDDLRAAGATVHLVDAGRMRQVRRWSRAVREIADLAREADVVCSWQVKGHYYGTPAARIARKPAAWWDHGIRPVRGEQSAFAGGSVPRMLHADLVLTSSHAAAARHRRARAVHPGIDLEPFAAAGERRAAVRAELGADRGPLVGIVGRLQPWKGQHVFLRAAARVAARRPDVRFTVVGGTPGGFSAGYPAQLRAIAAELGLEERVRFAGERADVPAVMAALDVFVHASTAEPFGIVIVEALAAGAPIVATRGGGVPEIVDDGHNGFLVAAGDDEEMAGRILRLIEEPSLAAAFASRGRERAARDFTADRMVAEFAAALETLAAVRRPVRA